MSYFSKKADKSSLPIVSTPSEGSFRISYTHPLEKVCDFCLRTLAPLTLLAISYMCMTIWRLIASGTFSLANPFYFVLALLLVVPYLVLLIAHLRTNFILTVGGITLPAVYFFAADCRLTWPWEQLQLVVFSRSKESVSTADQVILIFKNEHAQSVCSILVSLKSIDQMDLKKLVYAIVNSAPQVEFLPALDDVSLEFPTVKGIKHVNFMDFTSLWDEEFSTRFSPTLFVPLSAGSALRNGAIVISELVACGGSAAIYAAQNLQHENIIVKEAVIPQNTSEALKVKALELFNREALLLSRINHPNIAKVLDHFVENDHHYEILEFIDGMDLRRFVKERGPQPEAFVLNWTEQICAILIYLHRQVPPVIHRDLTPDNLVLRVDGNLVLIDFGAANAFVGTATGTMVGKQSYMPPEQIRGKSTPQSDIYALGCTAFFLLTGKDPTPLEPSQIEIKSPVSERLNLFLARCTEFEMSRRYGDAEEALRDIKALRAHIKAEYTDNVTTSSG